MKKIFITFIMMLTAAFICCQGCSVSKVRVAPPKVKSTTKPAVKKATSGKKVVYTAKSYIGVPYRFGGSSPKGFDCSGFTSYVYKRYGYKLPRRAKDQMKTGLYVPKKKLRPGDLVFFKVSYYGSYHVGIYTGGGKFIHAPRSGKRVEVQRLDKGYYKKKYITARRILKSG